MASYKETVGTAVVNYAGNYPGAADGELWYDSTNKDFKYQYANVTAAGSWRTGNNMNTARQTVGASGIYTSALAIGGSAPPGRLALTESYDGTSWTEVNDLGTARNNLVAVGADNTSSLAFGGATATANATNTESWNGTNWTEVNDLNTGRNSLADSGTVTSALAFGGATSPQGQTEQWNGTNWTEVNDLNTGRGALAGAGASNTAALGFGGGPPNVAITE